MLKLTRSRSDEIRRVKLLDKWVREVLVKQLTDEGGRLCVLYGAEDEIDRDEIERWKMEYSLSKVESVLWRPFGDPKALPRHQQFDAVCCFGQLEFAVKTEGDMTNALQSISSILCEGGILFGTSTDSSQLWTFAQKEIENRELERAKFIENLEGDRDAIVQAMGPSNGAIYLRKYKLFNLLFPLGEHFLPFGTSYRIDLVTERGDDTDSIGNESLIHLPSLMRIARDHAALEYMEIANYRDFYDDNRKNELVILERLGAFGPPCILGHDPEELIGPDVPVRKKPRQVPNPHEQDLMALFATFCFAKRRSKK